jgi:hypothetical protein
MTPSNVTKTRRKWPVIAGIVFIVGFVVAMIYTSGGNAKYRCEVCMTFDGNTKCSKAAGTTQTEAQRVATEAACSNLTSGMNNMEQCRNSEPKVTWIQ